MRTVDIPGGQAVLRERADMLRWQRRLLNTYVSAAGSTLEKVAATGKVGSAEEFQPLEALQEAAVVVALESWTLDAPLPTMETIGDMNADLFDALSEATRSMGDDIAATNFGPSPDEASPTVPSADSGSGSRETRTSRSTRKSRSDGTNTDTGNSSQD